MITDTKPADRSLLDQLGSRVRALRKSRGLSQKALSDRSGVSQRYLAQLEAGAGNISVGKLADIAASLDVPLAQMLSDGDEFGAQFASASHHVQARIRDILSAEHAKAGRICLIGLRGAGKSTLGASAAQQLGLPFVELSQEITEMSGLPLTEVMALYGPDGFRRLEALALDRALEAYNQMILAVAGGIVTGPETYNTLLAKCHTIWLQASPQEHMARVQAQGDTRPMAGHPKAMGELRTILDQRTPFYRMADAALDTSGHNESASLAGLLDIIRSFQS